MYSSVEINFNKFHFYIYESVLKVRRQYDIACMKTVHLVARWWQNPSYNGLHNTKTWKYLTYDFYLRRIPFFQRKFI